MTPLYRAYKAIEKAQSEIILNFWIEEAGSGQEEEYWGQIPGDDPGQADRRQPGRTPAREAPC